MVARREEAELLDTRAQRLKEDYVTQALVPCNGSPGNKQERDLVIVSSIGCAGAMETCFHTLTPPLPLCVALYKLLKLPEPQ